MTSERRGEVRDLANKWERWLRRRGLYWLARRVDILAFRVTDLPF